MAIMIGKDEEQEVSYKVADRRKFNPDGSVKEGVTLDPEPAKPEPPQAKPDEPAATAAADASAASEPAGEPAAPADTSDGGETDGADWTEEELEGLDADDLPGGKDPASFVNFLSFIATNAATALGAVPHPSTGQRMLDLDGGKYWLDVIAMLKEKTKGNLHAKEERLVDGLLADLRMQYVHLVRATEEKLKAQAAAKFSGDDILGKK